jgi:hypothetical protein
MIRFEDKKLVIEISTISRVEAVETWIELQQELLYLLSGADKDNMTDSTMFVMHNLLTNLLLPMDEAKVVADGYGDCGSSPQ